MCNNFPNIRITEGNNFSLVLPLRSRTYVATKPIDEDIDPEQLENVVVTFGGVEYPAQRTAQGVQIDLPSTLSVGTYNILLTADYLESSIRAAYESAVTIVPWSAQSTAEQYITGSPIVMCAAYVLSCVLTDAELEALKQEAREKIAEAEQAKEEAEQARREWEQKAADLDGVAKEATLEAVGEKIGSPAQGQPSTLFAAIAAGGGGGSFPTDYAKQGTNPDANISDIEAALNAIKSAYILRPTLDGYVFEDTVNPLQNPFSLCYNIGSILEIHDPNIQYVDGDMNVFSSLTIFDAPNCRELRDGLFYNNRKIKKIITPNAETISGNYVFRSCTNLRELNILNCRSLYLSYGIMSVPNLIDVTYGAKVNGNTSLLSNWDASIAILDNSTSLLTQEDIEAGFTSNLQKLLYNIREHIAANLPVAPLTITFSAAVKAAILADQQTADAFTNKGWTIA